MNTIGPSQRVQPVESGLPAQGPKNRLSIDTSKTILQAEETPTLDRLTEAGILAPPPQPKGGNQYLDPDQMRQYVARVVEAIRQASVEPHVVGFRPDPDSRGYLIEIRKPDGTLVTSFAPEKILNLNGIPDDLSGMVIDRKT